MSFFRKVILKLIPFTLAAVGLLAIFSWVKNLPDQALKKFKAALETQTHSQLEVFFTVNKITPASKLVLAKLEDIVSGTLSNQKEFLGLNLGTTSLTYHVPVTYLYGIDLSTQTDIDFDLSIEQHHLDVTFPSLEITAIETDLEHLKKTIDVGWARTRGGSGDDIERQFNANIMQVIRKHGEMKTTKALVRQTARDQLANFVEQFLASQSQLGPSRIETLQIHFQDESVVDKTIYRFSDQLKTN